MTVGLDTNASAEEVIELKSVEYIAQNWIDSQLSGNAGVSEIVCLYNEYKQQIGHLVSFVQGDIPYGYIVLSAEETEHPIIEFSLSGENIYSYLKSEFEATQNTVSNPMSMFSIADENVLYTDFINYSLKIENNNQVLLFNQNSQIKTFEQVELKSMRADIPTADTFYDDYVDFPSNSSGVSASWDIPGATSKALIMSNMPNAAAREGNCGPTALANTVKLYAEYKVNNQNPLKNLKLNDSNADTYKRLVALSGYTASSPATMPKLLDTLKAYSKERGCSCSIDDYWMDLWGDFTRDLKANKPVLLYTASSGGTAHAQVSVGYCSYNNGAQYIKIFSGWTSNATYVKFKPSSLKAFNGYCVKITG